MSKYDVLAIGMAVADIIIKPVNSLPDPGALVTIKDFQFSSGGVASTFSHDIARLGLKVGLLASIGKDFLGDMLLKDLMLDGIDVDLLRRVDKLASGATVVLVDDNGERSFYHYPGASLELISPETVPFEDFRHIHLGGSPLLSEYDGPSGVEVLGKARRVGVSTSIDTVYSPDGAWSGTRQLLKFTDIALPSFGEAIRLAETNDPIDQARYLLDRGVRIAVIKLGASGALICEKGGEPLMVHPPRVVPCDNTGAGEAFCSGFIFGYLNNWTISKTAEFAVSCGAFATQSMGGPLMISSVRDIENWMRKNPVVADLPDWSTE